jgi:hypothetical protein
MDGRPSSTVVWLRSRWIVRVSTRAVGAGFGTGGSEVGAALHPDSRCIKAWRISATVTSPTATMLAPSGR